MGMCVIIDRPATSLRVPPGRAHASMCAVTLRRARFEIPMQLLFCIVSHMASTINTGSNCSSQPAKVQNGESGGDRGWGWGKKKKSNICLKKSQEQGKGKEQSSERQKDSLLQ